MLPSVKERRLLQSFPSFPLINAGHNYETKVCPSLPRSCLNPLQQHIDLSVCSSQDEGCLQYQVHSA